MELTNDYAERVYAGVLGKVIGVYLGRPFAPVRFYPPENSTPICSVHLVHKAFA